MAIYIDGIDHIFKIEGDRAKVRTCAGATVTLSLTVADFYLRAYCSGNWTSVGDLPHKGISVVSRGGDKLICPPGLINLCGMDNPNRPVLTGVDCFISASGDLWYKEDHYSIAYYPNLLTMRHDFLVKHDKRSFAVGHTYEQNGSLMFIASQTVCRFTDLYTCLRSTLYEANL